MKIIIAAFFLLASLPALAQSNEYIVKNNGDTIRGHVEIFAKEIKVSKTATDVVTFNSEDVWKVVKNKSVKTVLRVVLYGYTDNIEAVQSPSYSDPVYDTTILLTAIITGEKLNLYSAKDVRRVEYFFVQRERDSIPVQLLYSVGGHMPEKASWGQNYAFVSYISRYKVFTRQLREMIDDCDYFTEADFDMLDYLESSLKKFVRQFNKKCGSSYNSSSK
jgi:hypothetical protein